MGQLESRLSKRITLIQSEVEMWVRLLRSVTWLQSVPTAIESYIATLLHIP
jgi:hypothetical protein